MIERIRKPTKEELAPLLLQATAKIKPEDWANKFTATMTRYLIRNPDHYRAFGPYWWLVKKALIDRGTLDFGEDIDDAAFAALDYGDETTNLLAAMSYYNVMFEIDRNRVVHTFEIDGGETLSYTLTDDDAERVSIARKLYR